MTVKNIRGSKGGAPSNPTPVTSPDSLRSQAFAQIIDLLSEGEISGLINVAKSITLNGTPVQNGDDSYNFQGFSYNFKTGTQAQTFIDGFADASNVLYVNTKVFNGVPITRTVVNPNVNAIQVIISTPALFSQDNSGNIGGTTVEFGIDLQDNGGGFVQQVADSFVGKTTGGYQRSYYIPVTGSGPWDIRIRRTTPDNVLTSIANDIYFNSYAEVINLKFSYPNSAIVGITVDSQYFSALPARAYACRGLIVQIPSNYNPTTRIYTGVWDGTFTTAYTNNPAWCFYDFVTNDRYGLGKNISAAAVDKFALYTIGQYCDELVADGFGGMEPRFTCNLYIQQQQDAYRLLADFCSIFRAMLYWSAGSLTVIQDSPSDPVYLYTAANVVGGLFTYQGSALTARHTVALVTYNDPNNSYQQAVEYVEDTIGIALFGYVTTQVTAVGCTSRGQAHRLGKYILLTERLEGDVVVFRTGLDGMIARPGQVIKVADPARSTVRLGGRITAVTSDTITLDAEVTLSAGFIYTLAFQAPDGSLIDNVEITNSAGVTSIIEAAAPFSQEPLLNAIWILQSDQVEPQLFKVIQAVEVEKHMVEISASAYRPDKFDGVDANLLLEPITNSTLASTTIEAPTNLSFTEYLYNDLGGVNSGVLLSWSQVPGATSYLVQYKFNDGNLVTLPLVRDNNTEILSTLPGIYEIRVFAVNIIGRQSLPATLTATVYGKTLPPEDVQNFDFTPTHDSLGVLSWDLATDLDVLIGGGVRIRYSPSLSGATWNDAIDISPLLPGTSRNATVPALEGTYLAKFIDSSDISSTNASTVSTTVTSLVNLNLVQTIIESPDFNGVKVDTAVDGGLGGLILQVGITVDEYGLIDSVGLIDESGGVAPYGTYDFENYYDMGAVYTTQISAYIAALGVDMSDLIDSRTNNIDDWVDFDGAIIDDVNAALYISTTNDDPAGTPTWSPYSLIFVGNYTARAVKFQLRMTSAVGNHNIIITDLEVSIDVPDRVQEQHGIVSTTGTDTITFPNGFWQAPAVGITARNMGTGDYYVLGTPTSTGFTIAFKNAAGSGVSRTYDYFAKGFGYRS